MLPSIVNRCAMMCLSVETLLVVLSKTKAHGTAISWPSYLWIGRKFADETLWIPRNDSDFLKTVFVFKWVPPIPPNCADRLSISLQPNFKSDRLSLRNAGTSSLHEATPVLVQHAAGVGNQESFRSVKKLRFVGRPTAVRKRRFIGRFCDAPIDAG